MSVRTELEELVKWISELSAKKEKPDPTHSPSREVWQAVDGDLRRASRKFAEARVVLRRARVGPVAKDPRTIVAEFAGDLEHEAEALALRAHLLSRRAKPTTEPAKPKPITPATEAATTEAATTEAASAGRPPNAVPAREPEDRHSPGRLVKSAGDTIETAHQKLEAVEPPDPVTKAFEEELDVLAEMTLSLREQCERLEEEREEVPD
jgi:hypothetical protein